MEKIVYAYIYGKSEIKFKSYAVAVVVACRNVCGVRSRNVYKEIERNKLFFCDADSNKDDDDDIRLNNFPHENFSYFSSLFTLSPTKVIISLTFICRSRNILFLKLPEWNDEGGFYLFLFPLSTFYAFEKCSSWFLFASICLRGFVKFFHLLIVW